MCGGLPQWCFTFGISVDFHHPRDFFQIYLVLPSRLRANIDAFFDAEHIINLFLGCIKTNVMEGGSPPALLCPGEVTSGILCPILGSSIQKWKDIQSSEGLQNWLGAWSFSCVRKGWKTWDSSTHGEGWEVISSLFTNIYSQVNGSRLFSVVCSNRTKGNGDWNTLEHRKHGTGTQAGKTSLLWG